MKLNLMKIHAYIVNPLLNVLGFMYTNVFYENHTHIGNTLHHPIYFFLWTISSCFGYYYYSKRIWEERHLSYHKKLHTGLILIIILSIFIPYSPSLPGWINDGHVWLAIAGVTGFMLEWVYIALHSPLQYKKECKILFFIFTFSTFLIFLFGHVTSIAEMTFSTMVNIYTFYWIKKEESLK